jgi:hypothetical protein
LLIVSNKMGWRLTQIVKSPLSAAELTKAALLSRVLLLLPASAQHMS